MTISKSPLTKTQSRVKTDEKCNPVNPWHGYTTTTKNRPIKRSDLTDDFGQGAPLTKNEKKKKKKCCLYRSKFKKKCSCCLSLRLSPCSLAQKSGTEAACITSSDRGGHLNNARASFLISRLFREENAILSYENRQITIESRSLLLFQGRTITVATLRPTSFFTLLLSSF